MMPICSKCGCERTGSHTCYCRACFTTYRRERRANATPESKAKALASRRAYYQTHREQERAYNKRWMEENKDRRKAMRAVWYTATRHIQMAYTVAWSKRNPEKKRAYLATTRANRRLQSKGGRVSSADWAAIKLRHKGRCFYCDKKPARLTMDHYRPLAAGGPHDPSNIVPACRSCNCSKQHMPPEQFALRRGRLCW